MKAVRAVIQWLSVQEGGRQELPSGPEYSTVARFPELDDPWPEEAWSVVAILDSEADTNRRQKARILFLVENAPLELLRDGASFDLYEGRSRVATVVVV